MRSRPRSVRLRLTLWYAGAFAAMILVFSTGVYLFVRAALYSEMERQLDMVLATVTKLQDEEPDEIDELEEHDPVNMFCITEGNRIIYRSMSFGRAGLPVPLEASRPGPSVTWVASKGRSYLLKTNTAEIGGRTIRIGAALDGETMTKSLKALAFTLAVGLPLAVLLAVAGGYLLAGRMLSPVAAMAAKAEKITAERLSERLPVEEPDDEFGRLAAAFNDTLARLENAFERLRRFTADASHELRTPLTALKSVGEVGIQSGRSPEYYRDVIGSMLEEADRLARLVENLLALTRTESDRTRRHWEPVALDALAVEVVDCLRVLAEEKKQDLRVSAEEPVNVKGNRAALRQALMNLLDNAVKYTQAKGRVRVTVRKSGKDEAVCEVADNGPGIPESERGKIFERFFRLEKGRSRETGGSGLGLSIARRAVEDHGGRIEVESEPGSGSIFRVVLPESPPDKD